MRDLSEMNDTELEGEVIRLRAQLAEARAAMVPFASIGFDPVATGSRYRAREILLGEKDEGRFHFTGADLARARKFMEDTSDV
jgi:hypothetical protein